MSWSLKPEMSEQGESPGDEANWMASRFDHQGSRFTISGGRLFLTDYRQLGDTYHDNASSYVRQVLEVRGLYWSGRLRIRANHDTYCYAKPNPIYVGKTYFDDNEHFNGYILGASNTPTGFRGPLPPPPLLWSGPHNHGQVGERWSIPQPGSRADGVSSRQGGLVGVWSSLDGWDWARTRHNNFIIKMRKMLPSLGRKRPIRFYITCYGYIVTPIQEHFWNSHHGLTDLDRSVERIRTYSPSAAKSALTRVANAQDDRRKPVTLYFVCGHIDDLMDGQPPEPNLNGSDFGNPPPEDPFDW